MRQILPEIAIVTCWRHGKPNEENWRNWHQLLSQVRHLPHKVVKGCYYNQIEPSILLAGEHANVVAAELAAQYKQDSYLYADEQRQAKLVFGDGREHTLGRLQRHTGSELPTCYTETQGEIWVTI